jgi:hypothetical protein
MTLIKEDVMKTAVKTYQPRMWQKNG